MRNEILDNILRIVNYYYKCGMLTEKNLDDDLLEGGLESIAFVSIVLAIEESFSIEIPEDYLLMSEMNTINKMKKIIEMLV